MENVLRGLLYLAIGILLVLANVLYVRSLRRAFFGAGEVAIAPFVIVGKDDPEGRLGGSLAQMLQAQLLKIQRELEVSQRSLVVEPPSTPGPALPDEDDPRALLVALRPVSIPTAVFEPVKIDVKVGGVEVGGLFSWLQRTLVRPRTATFTVSYRENAPAIVTADLQAFRVDGQGDLWLNWQATPDEIATTVAYALVQRRLSGKDPTVIDALEPEEFRELLETLFRLARLNRQVASGRDASNSFAALLPVLGKLTSRVPEWHELTYLAGNVAESAGQKDKALAYYRQIQLTAKPDAKRPVSPEILAKVENKLETSPTLASQTPTAEQTFVEKAKEYARKLGLNSPDPAIAFVEPAYESVYAIWNEDLKRYEVNPKLAGAPGLPKYVALMGRFMAQHYGRCVDQLGPAELWNDFRSSAVEYVIQASGDEGGSPFDQRAYNMEVFKALKQLEAETGEQESVRQLALRLLEGYECDWNRNSFPAKVTAFNKLIPKPISNDKIKRAFRAFQPESAPAG